MSSYRPRRLDRSTAERLLAGDRATADTNAGTAVALLATALRAAAAPAHPEELTGERAALAAYTTARLGPVPETRRQSMFKSALAKVLTVKAAVVGIAVVGASGVALAAGTGALPWSGTPADPPAPSKAATPSTPPPVTATGRPSDAGKPADKPAATPAPSLDGLCQAYEAQVAENPGKALESPAFEALVEAAGGPDEVPDYCATVTKDHPAGKPSDLPTPAQPGGGNAPSTRPTPSDRPSTPGSPANAADPGGTGTPHRGG